MELIEGMELFQPLEKLGKYTEEKARDIFK